MIKVQNIAVLSSGGDAPGMNACIRALVRAGLFNNINVFGIFDGFNGLMNGDFKQLFYDDVSHILQRGGTILGTARSLNFKEASFRKIAHDNLVRQNIDALVIIGGDGSFKGGGVFADEFSFPVIGIPATIDNDINGTDYSLGYDTALNTIVDAIDKIRDTASSHHRVFLVEVMGNNSGVLALNTALACGAEEVFVPEREEDMVSFENNICRAVAAKKSSIIVVSEGDQMGGAKELYNYLKAKGLADKVRYAVLGHIQRGGSPTFLDRQNAALFGQKTIELLMEGKHHLMVGIQNGQLSSCDLKEAFKPKPFDSSRHLALIRSLSSY